MRRNKTAWLLLTAAAACATGCQTTPKPRVDPTARNDAERLSQENLETVDRLTDFADYFRSTISSVGFELVRQTPDLDTRASIRFWQLRLIPTMYEIINQPNAKAASVDVLIYCIQTREWLENQDGTLVSPAARAAAIKAHKDFEARAWELVRASVTPENFETVEAFVNNWVEQNKLVDIDTRDRATTLTAYRYADPYEALTSKSGMFGNIQSGLGDTNYELRRLRSEIKQMNQFFDMAPMYARWSAEILLYDLLESEYAERLNESLFTTGQELTELNDTINELAEIVQTQLPQIQAEFEGPLAEASQNLRAALDDGKLMIQDARSLTTQADELVSKLDAAGQSWERTALAATSLVEQMPATPDNQLDLGSLNELLDKLTAVSETNLALVTELRAMTEPDQTDAQIQQLDAILARAEHRGRTLIRTAALYAAGLVLLGAALYLGIRRYSANPG